MFALLLRNDVVFSVFLSVAPLVYLVDVPVELGPPSLLSRTRTAGLPAPLAEIPFRHEMAVYGVHALPVAW